MVKYCLGNLDLGSGRYGLSTWFFAHVLISLVFHTVLQIRKSSCVGTWDLISIWAGPDSKGRSRSFCIGNTKCYPLKNISKT
jgi:hypothetical protein